MVSCGRPAATPGSRRRRHPRSRPASLAAADADADAATAAARGEWSRVSMMVREAARALRTDACEPVVGKEALVVVGLAPQRVVGPEGTEQRWGHVAPVGHHKHGQPRVQRVERGVPHDRDRAGEQRLQSTGRAVPMPCPHAHTQHAHAHAHAQHNMHMHVRCTCGAPPKCGARRRRCRAVRVRSDGAPWPRGTARL